MRVWTFTLVLFLAPVVLLGQALTPQTILNPGTDTWPTYNGDYSGRRHSPLDQINASNVASLTSAWMYRASNYGASGFGPERVASLRLVAGRHPGPARPDTGRRRLR